VVTLITPGASPAGEHARPARRTSPTPVCGTADGRRPPLLQADVAVACWPCRVQARTPGWRRCLVEGAVRDRESAHRVPKLIQCLSCHATDLSPLGVGGRFSILEHHEGAAQIAKRRAVGRTAPPGGASGIPVGDDLIDWIAASHPEAAATCDLQSRNAITTRGVPNTSHQMAAPYGAAASSKTSPRLSRSWSCGRVGRVAARIAGSGMRVLGDCPSWVVLRSWVAGLVRLTGVSRTLRGVG